MSSFSAKEQGKQKTWSGKFFCLFSKGCLSEVKRIETDLKATLRLSFFCKKNLNYIAYGIGRRVRNTWTKKKKESLWNKRQHQNLEPNFCIHWIIEGICRVCSEMIRIYLPQTVWPHCSKESRKLLTSPLILPSQVLPNCNGCSDPPPWT